MSPTPIRSDRSVRDVINYPDLHASDIETDLARYHLPAGTDGDTLIWDTDQWTPVLKRLIVYFSFEGTLAIGENPIRLLNLSERTRTIVGVYLIVKDAPTGDAIIVDVHMDETTIFTTQSNRPQIAASATTGNSVTVENDQWDDGSYLTASIDQVGSSTPGSYLTVHVVYTEA